MISLLQAVRLELELILRMKHQFAKELECLPEGHLAKSLTRGHTYLRWRFDGMDKHLSMSSEKDIETAKKLRRKRFIQKMIKDIDNNIRILKEFLRKYTALNPIGVMDSLSDTYKLPPGREKEVPEGFVPQRAEDCDFKSKSEQIIALVLEANNIEYMYEWGHMLDGVLYWPDFTLRHPGTGEFIVYEHFGMIDQPGYYEKMIKKLIDYWYAGIRLGENLIVTFETKDNPLTANDVQATLNAMLKKED